MRAIFGAGMVVALLGAAGPARALSLADVDAFPSGNGILFFSNFEAVATGALAGLDLSFIEILPTMTGFGFEFVGPFSVKDGEIGDLIVRFDVDSELPIVAVELTFNGAAAVPGAGATVTETFEGLNAQAFVFATGGGGRRLSDTADLGGQFDGLQVIKDILLDSTVLGGPPHDGATADISLIRQEFQVIPEPSTLGLLALGLLGALFLRRRV